MAKINHQQLLSFCKTLLATGGMPTDDADLVGDLLVKGELRGYAGHGVIRITQYLEFIKNGIYKLSEKPAVEREGKITAVVDGKHYIGQVAARFAMELAIKKAQEHGAGIVCLRRAGHTGRLADYMEMATDHGMIGFGAACVGSPVTTLYGGMKPITGTNPMAFGIPARGGRHIILDFATASMSMGEIQNRVRQQRKNSRRRDARRPRQSDERFQIFSRPAARRVFAFRRPQRFRHRVNHRNSRRHSLRQWHGPNLVEQWRPRRQRLIFASLRRRGVSSLWNLSTTKSTS